MDGSAREDIELNRDLVMALDPARSGLLRVRHKTTRDDVLPKVGEIDYLVEVATEADETVFLFDIPAGAPRARRQ